MRRLAIFVLRRRWWVIGVAVVALPLFAIFGGNVRHKLITGGFDDPGAEATRAQNAVSREFPKSGISDFAVLVTAKKGTVDDPAVADAGRAITKQLNADRDVAGASSYWSESDAIPQHLFKVEFLRSRDSKQALVFAALKGTDDEKIKTAGRLTKDFAQHPNPAVTTQVTGRAEITRELADQAQKDLEKADFLSAPFTFGALLIVFGSLVAAFLPLSVGLIAVLGGFLILTIITGFTDVSVFSLNLVTGLGLGLAIDYSLFIVSRYREELGQGASSPVAIGRTMQTAGRTVAFSAGTVAISLSTLIIFPMPYLRSFAYAGVAVVALAALASCIILPAVLAVLGERVEKFRLYKPRETTEGGFWARQANRVMRHPVIYAVSVTIILVLLAIPFFHVRPGLSDDRVGPPGMTSHLATQQIRDNFDSREGSALLVYVPSITIRDIDAKATPDKKKLEQFAAAVAKVPGVYRVDAATGYDNLHIGGKLFPHVPATSLSTRFLSPAGATGTYLSVVPNVEPYSARGEKLVKDIRALRNTAPFEFLVAGSSANLVDTKEAVLSRLPLALLLIALATFVLLFMMTGSVLVPIKALVLNVLSLTATFGAMVWIFQDGHLSSWLHFTPTGTIDVFTPILMFCIAFGMSMDYEVFLLSRIKEEYDLEHDNERAVASGLQKTGRIVTAAALLLVIVFACIATADVVLVKALGVGLGLAVLVDAFLIRATLVPAFMRLAGRLNWWSPRWLRRWHLRFGIWENEPVAILDRQFEASVT